MYTENKYFLTSRWMIHPGSMQCLGFQFCNDTCKMTQYLKRNFKLYFLTGSKSICGEVENYSLKFPELNLAMLMGGDNAYQSEIK